MWAGKGCPLTEARDFWPLKNNSLQIHLETSQISSQTQMAKQKKSFCHPQRVGNSFCLCCTFVVTRFSPSSLTWNWSPEWWQTSPPLNPEKPEKPGPVSRAPSNECWNSWITSKPEASSSPGSWRSGPSLHLSARSASRCPGCTWTAGKQVQVSH